MQIVIDIPEEIIKEAKDSPNYYPTYHFKEIWRAIVNGTPLPKGHGKLIDIDVLDKDLENAQVNLGDDLSEAFDDGLMWASEVASKSSTIVEADKARKRG